MPPLRIRLAARTRAAARRAVGRSRSPSALVVPVPAAEPAFSELRGRFPLDEPPGMPPHVTVVFPFAPVDELSDDVSKRLDQLAATIEPFDFVLRSIRRFPGVIYLAPEPADRFVSLTEAAWRAWPRYPPYEGRHRDVIPHLTLTMGDEPPGIEAAAAGLLPIDARAEELWLMADTTSGWERRWRSRLGG